MTTDSKTALRLGNVTIRFPQKELVFDCTVPAGEIVAVTGPSGAGKSTLFNLIAGFESPDAGTIEIFGRDVTQEDPADRPVSIIFQDYNLFAHLDVATNIGLGIHPSLRLSAGNRQEISRALVKVGLDGFEKRSPATLSGGERQRVAFARALVRKRPLLLLDEPFAALDPGLRSEMSTLLLELHRETNNTVLIITHQPEDVEKLATSAIFIDEGQVVLHEKVENFLKRRDITALSAFLGP